MGINAIAANCPIGSPAPSSQNGTETNPTPKGPTELPKVV